MKKILLFAAIILSNSLPSTAQHGAKSHSHKAAAYKAAKTNEINPARGVVSNKYSYYNTERGGYVIYDNGRESFVPSLPIIPENTKLIRTSLPLGKRLDLDLYPQLHYPNTQVVHPDQNSN